MESKIVGVGVSGLDTPTPISVVMKRLSKESPIKLPTRAIPTLTGVKQVFHSPDGVNASDLATDAARACLKVAAARPEQVDLLIFASASQDLIEPATAHIVSANLGTSCPVMDVSNACNSFLNGLQVADLFIRSGTHKTVLVVTGETPSMAIRWACETQQQFQSAFPGYSMSDSGGAVLLTASKTGSINRITMSANSEHWNVGMLDMGGSRNPRNLDTTYFNMDGGKLFKAFADFGTDILKDVDWGEFDNIGMHQISSTYNALLAERLNLPEDKLIHTIVEHGNLASNSLPVQLLKAQSGKFAFIGLGGGISTGLGEFTL